MRIRALVSGVMSAAWLAGASFAGASDVAPAMSALGVQNDAVPGPTAMQLLSAHLTTTADGSRTDNDSNLSRLSEYMAQPQPAVSNATALLEQLSVSPTIPSQTPRGQGQLLAQAGSPPATDASPASQYRVVTFARAVIKVPLGAPFLTVAVGPTCAAKAVQTSAGGQDDFKLASLTTTFNEEIEKAGLRSDGPASLFDTAPSSADFAVAGAITEFNAHVCSPVATQESIGIQKGDVHITIEWELYSRLELKVVGRYKTSADFAIYEARPGGLAFILDRAFAGNVKALAETPEFRMALSGKTLADNEAVKPTPQAPLVIKVAAGARPIAEVAKSVVIVRSGAGMGSGVLISSQGYILTAAHVVGTSDRVKIRWADHKELDGTVVRIDAGRDVALIHTDATGHYPLAVRTDDVAVGEQVYAVGSPLTAELEGTVTRGVISGHRLFAGYNFLQSDVAVTHGNSGGPLVDAQGRVIGLTIKGLPADVASGLNFFAPVKDALQFLSVKLRP